MFNLTPTLSKLFSFFLKMNFAVDSELSCVAGDLLNKLNLKFGSEKSETSKLWLELFNYNFESSSDILAMDLDDNATEGVINLMKESLERKSTVPETIFVGLSVNEVNRVFCTVRDFLDETKFSAFCDLISSWNKCPLLEYSLGTVVLPKLQENSETSACITYSIKQLALRKPESVSQYLITPLLMDDSFQFTDSEFLMEIFSTLPDAQKDFIILTLSKKSKFQDNDWQLLNPLIKSMSQNSILILTECVIKYTNEFRKSQVFGRFLVNFCKHVNFIRNKEALRKAIEKHETLLKTQALKYLDLI